MKGVRILYEVSPDIIHNVKSMFKGVKKRFEGTYDLNLETDFCDSSQTLKLLENRRYDFLVIHLGEESELKTGKGRPSGAQTKDRPIGVYRRAKAAKRISPKTITLAERSMYVPEMFAGLETQKWFDETTANIPQSWIRPGQNFEKV